MPAPSASLLDYPQVLQHAFDDSLWALRTTGSAVLNPTGSIAISVTSTEDSFSLGFPDGASATYTSVSGKTGLDVSVLGGLTGSFTQTGLSVGLSTTSVIITDVPTAIPTVVLPSRNGISVRVISAEPVFFGPSGVTVDNGYPKYQREEIVADVKDNSAVLIYGVCAAGATSEVRVMQIA